MTSTIILNPGPSGKLHHPEPHDHGIIRDGNTINTQAATSLQSGPFQYVNSNLFKKVVGPFLIEISSMAYDPQTGKLFILRRTDPVVIVLDGEGNISATWTAAATGIKTGHSIKLHSVGSPPQMGVWVADMEASCIWIFSESGGSLGPPLGPQLEDITLGKVTDIAWDDNIGSVYITDGDTGGQYNRVIVYSATGSILAIWGGTAPGSGPGEFNLPHAVAVDALSRVWIVDSMNSRVQVFSSAGALVGIWLYPGLELYGISISSSTTDMGPNSPIVYITGNSLSDPRGKTGQLMLVPAAMDSTKPAEIGSGEPLTSWSIPCMLHSITSTETPVYQLLTSTLSSDPAQPAQAFQRSTPRPLITQDPNPSSPIWPTKFTANLLLHPFKWGELPQVACVTYYEGHAIWFNVYTLAGMYSEFAYLLVNGSVQYWYRLSDTSPWVGPLTTKMVIPAHDWLVSKTTYQGDSPLLGNPIAWWCEKLSQIEFTPTNWHWFRTDTNVPFRTMNSVDANPDNIPIIGEYSFIYWTSVQSVDSLPELERALEEIRSAAADGRNDSATVKALPTSAFMTALDDLIGKDTCPLTPTERSSNIEMVQTLIPGLTPGTDGLPLPIWPDTFFMTCIMTPVNRVIPMSTEVLYNWQTIDLRTRMFNADQQSAIDAVENRVGTYQINRFADGSCSTDGDPLLGLGPPQPTWATSGGGDIVATIINNPDFCPGYTIRIFRELMDEEHGRQFWIWYSDSDRDIRDTPVVFIETAPPAQEGTSLALADYREMDLTQLVDPVSYTVSPPFL